MAKQKKTDQDNNNELVEQNQSVDPVQAQAADSFSHTAIGVFKDPVTYFWCLAEITYDPATGKVGSFNKVQAGTERGEANERFKIEAGKKVLR